MCLLARLLSGLQRIPRTGSLENSRLNLSVIKPLECVLKWLCVYVSWLLDLMCNLPFVEPMWYKLCGSSLTSPVFL